MSAGAKLHDRQRDDPEYFKSRRVTVAPLLHVSWAVLGGFL